MYDLIGVLGYIIIVCLSYSRRCVAETAENLGEAARNWHRRALEKHSGSARMTDPRFWAKWEITVLVIIHLFMFTFGGTFLGEYIGRVTDFYGYVLCTAMAVGLACSMLGSDVLSRIDAMVPIFLTVASVLKLSCFCQGCCNGLPWQYGWYNITAARREFPIQLVEMAFYAALLWILSRPRTMGRPGYRFAYFLMGYAAFRFAVQFFRSDMAPFSPFHWVSAAVFAVGAIYWVVDHCIARAKNASVNNV